MSTTSGKTFSLYFSQVTPDSLLRIYKFSPIRNLTDIFIFFLNDFLYPSSVPILTHNFIDSLRLSNTKSIESLTVQSSL